MASNGLVRQGMINKADRSLREYYDTENGFLPVSHRNAATRMGETCMEHVCYPNCKVISSCAAFGTPAYFTPLCTTDALCSSQK